MLEKLKNKLSAPQLTDEQKQFYNSAILAYEVIINYTCICALNFNPLLSGCATLLDQV